MGLLVSALQSPNALAYRLPSGCHNAVLKKGYDFHLSFSHLAGLTAAYHLNRYYDGLTYSDEIADRLDFLFKMPRPELPAVWNRYINPLVKKGFAYKIQYNGRQGVEISSYGKIAARKNFAAFYETYAARAKREELKPKGLSQLVVGRKPDASHIDLSLSDYLILSQFNVGEVAGSTEVYKKISDQLSYYSIFQPPSPTSVTTRLMGFSQRGYLDFENVDFQSRARGGSLYKFVLRREGQQALDRFEAAYLELLSAWLKTDLAEGQTELRDKIKELKK